MVEHAVPLTKTVSCIGDSQNSPVLHLCGNTYEMGKKTVMLVKQCHKPPIVSWFLPPMYGDLYCTMFIVESTYMPIPNLCRSSPFQVPRDYPNHSFCNIKPKHIIISLFCSTVLPISWDAIQWSHSMANPRFPVTLRGGFVWAAR
jgi:hypothetical protein